jgi:hypothetical protein
MALFSIERIGDWKEGQLGQALVIAPNATEALKRVEHLTGPHAAVSYKVTREPTSGTRLLATIFND